MALKNLPLIFLVIFLLLLYIPLNLHQTPEQHFVFLAKSFLKGSLAFTPVPENISDTALFNGKYYWPLGPLPAILFIPFVLLFDNINQSVFQLPLNILNFYLVFRISRSFKLSKEKSCFLAIFYIFGSTYTPVGAFAASWFLSQVISTTLLLLALYEFQYKKRGLLAGIAIALSTATRFTTVFTSLFFIILILKNPRPLKNIILLITPIIISLSILAIYNFQRFRNPFESGYNYQLIYHPAELRRNDGLFSAKHIDENLYYMFINGPRPVLEKYSNTLKFPYITFDGYGLSLFFLSPVLFLIVKAKFKDRIVWASAITILVSAIPIITYYGIGYVQVGFRYALDFFPFLLPPLATAISGVKAKFLYPLVLFGVFFAIFFTFQYLAGSNL